MKVLIVNTNIGYGGASKILAWVANYLADQDDKVTFYIYRDDAVKQTLNSDVRIVYEKSNQPEGSLKGILSDILRFRKYIRKGRFDIAIAFLPPSQLRLVPACIGLKTKVIVSQRGDPWQLPLKTAMSRIQKWLFSKADGFVFQTQSAMDFYKKRVRRKGVVIPNPIECTTLPNARVMERERRIVSVGRLDIRQKRQDILIKAFQLIEDEFPDHILEFYGDGDDEAALKELVGSDRQIIFKGVSHTILKDIQTASAFVMTSDFEGIPNALMEAMAVGLPCVSTDCSPGGAALLLKNGENGLLVPRGDHEKVADAIRFVLCHPDEAKYMGEKATEVTKNFSPERIGVQWKEYIYGISSKG